MKIFEKALLWALLSLAITLPAHAEPRIENIKFGILRKMPNGDYSMDIETTRIPRKLKETGFRFGIAFDNPKADTIQWYKLVRLPSPVHEVSGNLRQTSQNMLQSGIRESNQQHVVDHFWFDQGDPLGKHKLELYVNGKRKFSINFEVVPE